MRVLKALTPIALAADQTLAERAVATYEFLPPTRRESAESLRAAGLMLLHTLDPEAAAYAAVRLLIDPHTSYMSGEPAITAARLLAAGDYFLPLYYYVVDSREKVSEVVAECLKGLAGAPAAVVDALVEQYRETADDLLLAGLFDLILGGAGRSRYGSFLESFLRTTRRLDVYRYLVTALVAGHQAADLALVLDTARNEQDPRKIEILLPALETGARRSGCAGVDRTIAQRPAEEVAMTRTIEVRTPELTYPILIGDRVLDEVGAFTANLRLGKHVAIATDSTVAPLHGQRIRGALEAAGYTVALVAMPAGEQHKGWAALDGYIRGFAEGGLDRSGLGAGPGRRGGRRHGGAGGGPLYAWRAAGAGADDAAGDGRCQRGRQGRD